MKRAHGFTLVEMMITVAIVAILMAMAMPSFTQFIQNAQIRTATENMQSGISHARSEALRRNARVSFWMVSNTTAACARSATGTSWVVSFANPAGACDATSSETVAPRLIQSRAGSDGSSNVAVTAVDAGGAATSCITFNGFGQVEAACTGGGNPIARVTFASSVAPASHRTLEMRVTSGGSIRMCNPAMTTTTDPAHCGP